MEGKKRDFEDIEITDALSDKKGKVYKNTNPPKGGIRGKWKNMKKWKKAVIIIVAVLVLLFLAAIITTWAVYNSGFRKNVNEDNLALSETHDSGIFNVAVFGVDTRDKDAFTGRSDTIMIVSVDRKNKTVKLTSILRDSYVEIEGHKNQKITHAYAFGGAELAINTINRNFKMNITDYATINFYKMAEAIDILGGIDIEITKSEMEQINSEALGGTQKGAALVNSYGPVHLDGDQATIFCRLRKQDSDEARSNRQKMVINALLAQARKVSPTKYAEVVKAIMSLCETSLTFSEVMSFVPMINEEINIEAITVPGEPENAVGGIYDGAWVWRYDLEEATNRIHMFIYGELPSADYSASSPSSSKTKTTTTAANKNNGNTSDNSRNGDGTIVIKGDGSSGNSENTTAPETTTAAVTEAPTQAETTTQAQVTERVTEAPTQAETTAAQTQPEQTQPADEGN